MDERLRAICAQYGVFLAKEALTLGYNDRDIVRLTRHGVWHRVRRGAYVFALEWQAADAEGRHRIKSRAVLRAAKTDAVLSHTSALLEYGTHLWDLDLSEVHLTRHDGRSGRREAGVRQHQGLMGPEDFTVLNGVPVTSATRTALDLTTIADLEHSLVVVDGLLHAKQTSPQLLADRYASMTQWPHTLHTDLVLRLADARSASAGESRTKFLCWRQGLPKPELQYEVYDEFGNLVATLDFAWPKLGAFAEFDGMVKYGALLRDGQSAKDVIVAEQRREELVCKLTGWRGTRVIWRDLRLPTQTAARIANTFDDGSAAA